MIRLNHRGRINLMTDVPEIHSGNIIDVLRDVYNDHIINREDCITLIDFEAGEQPLGRVKKYRSDIDWQIATNLAAYIVDFKLGFHWGNPITLVQRGNDETQNEPEAIAVQRLNECYAMSGNDSDTQELARFIEICGIGYSYIDINMDWEDGESYFTRDILDPRNTFVVHSSYYTDKRPMLGVTYRKDKQGVTYFTCFTKDQRFELKTDNYFSDKWQGLDGNGEKNPLGIIPIIEWIRSHDRQGCFERQLENLQKLNLLSSDAANAIDQNVLSVWHANDVEFEQETIKNEDGTETVREKKPQSGDWMLTYTTREGKQPFIKPLTMDYGLQGIMEEYSKTETTILVNCHIPTRNDNSGGSTGIAMSDAAGWSDAETHAAAQERITDGCKINEVKVVLRALKESPFVEPSDDMLKLRAWDLQPNNRRNKSYELTVKANSVATLLSHGFALEDCLDIVPISSDPSQVILRSGEGVRKYQETVWRIENSAEGGEGESSPDNGKLMADYSDETSQSPALQRIT